MKSVYLNLFQEEQVDYIMRTLEKLDFLNGLKVERDILNEESSVGGTETDEQNHQSHDNRQLNVDT